MLKTMVQPQLEIDYPESDGEPMVETEIHLLQLLDALLHPLKERFRNQLVYVVGNMFLYYEEGNPRAVVAPDLFVVFGVDKALRRTYKVWEEGKGPDVVFELTSKKTYRADLGDKRLLYETLGVQEYFLFDPLDEYLRPSLQGFRMVDGFYMPLFPEQVEPGVWTLNSEQLGLVLRVEQGQLRFFDEVSGQYLLTRPEEATAHRESQRHLEQERRLRHEAEAEIARLRALLGDSG